MCENLFKIDATVREKAPQLFGKTEKSLNEDVDTIQKWMKTQHHLPETMDKAKIRNFLLLNKCSIEKTKQKIDMYYTIRSTIPDLYDDANPKNAPLREYMDVSCLAIHPVPHEEMYRVLFYKARSPNSVIPRLEAIQSFNVTEVRLYEDCMVGEVLICDMANISFNDLLKMTPDFIAKVVAVYQNVYSFRMRRMYIVNSPSFIGHFMTILKKMIKPKIFERIHVYENCDVLQEVFSKDVLPQDYGGDGPSLDELHGILKNKLNEYQDRFDKLDELRVNEQLRPKKLKNDEILGFHGNFKKLEVD